MAPRFYSLDFGFPITIAEQISLKEKEKKVSGH
jgi:hypothetical protein